MIDKERLKIIADDIKWLNKSMPLLDLTNPDDVLLHNKYLNKIQEHTEYLNNVKKTLGIE